MNGLLFPNALWTPHVGQDGGRGMSPRLWSKAMESMFSPDGSNPGFLRVDDLDTFYPVTVTTAAGQLQPGMDYFAYIEADATVGSILPIATEQFGVIRFLTSTDTSDGDNHDTTLVTGGNVGTMCKITDVDHASNSADAKVLIFEARFRLNSVTDGDGSVFIGLGEEGLGAANTPIVDSTGHKISSDDLIGFFIGEDDNDALKFVYRKNGQAIQTVLTYSTALVASTWYKVGFVYDPRRDASERLAIYIDNVEQTTYVTEDNISAATFPDDEELAAVFSIKGSANNDAQQFDMDWWGVYQGADSA